ncbi:ABC-type multidrug transport system ATPase and permease component [Vibrio astriarenae]|nr:ABC-type multidrug transport system ATPase and permease component [Vibrio sp. C7]
MNNKIIKIGAVAGVVLALSGCVGSNAVTGKLMEFNVKAVDNRYARGGLNMLLAPVYGITVAADYIVFNSLEFWTGKNPINGNPHIFDTKTDTYIEVNHQLDPSLREAPVPPITQMRSIEKGQMQQIDENTLQMDITYNNGETATLVGVKQGDDVTFFLDGEAIAQTSIQELEAYANTSAS